MKTDSTKSMCWSTVAIICTIIAIVCQLQHHPVLSFSFCFATMVAFGISTVHLIRHCRQRIG